MESGWKTRGFFDDIAGSPLLLVIIAIDIRGYDLMKGGLFAQVAWSV